MDTLSLIGNELLGVGARNLPEIEPSAVLADGVKAKVGMPVYFTADGAKKIVEGMIKGVSAKSVNDLISKAADLFGQHLPEEKIEAFETKMTERIQTLSKNPVTVTAISGENKVDVNGPGEFLPNIPSFFFTSKRESGSVLDFLKKQVGPLPLWGWSLVGAGVVSATVLLVRVVRK